MAVLLVAGVLSMGVGVFMARALENDTAQTNGLAFIWFGAILVVRSMIGSNRRAGMLVWALGGGSLYYVFAYTDLPHTLTDGSGTWIVSTLLLLLAAAVYLHSRRKPPPSRDEAGRG
ncbi:hypothetical protein OG946_08930 [Streptomyces sp. NBC_01808]|uniref:hypothetical protein n=1 Tax=Streptomyces sp. NBC_01808 TaxID=2975947 RepID=UPI002DDA1296|nr:hypothetical protein [Streptomyces sp. NBC_01808]WSA37495.1 hypothetical protein OG946_08930 [Streptomyces sp. NBC_01808]